MENYNLENDIHLFCVKADSFPAGITDAQQRLTAILAPGDKRNLFGVSYLYDDAILYMAAAEYTQVSENIPERCTTYTLKRGNYISIYIADFAKDISQVEKAFKKLLQHPNIDENGCCAECYLPEGAGYANAKDIRCMVRLAD